MQIGMLAPWPNYWRLSVEYGSPFFLISSIEAAVLYVGLLALIICMSKLKSRSMLTTVYVAMVVMATYGMTTPFLGALYRYRFPWWIMLLCLGLASILFIAGRYHSNGGQVDHGFAKMHVESPGQLPNQQP
jgi:hypothetical protein